MNKNYLKSKMALHGDTGANLAEYLGISQNTFSLKLNGTLVFTQIEIQKIKEKYGLTSEELDAIFFSHSVS